MSQFPVIDIRSVDLGTPDVDGSLAFYTDVWGLTLVEQRNDVAYLCATGQDHHVLTLRLSAVPEVRCVTFRVAAQEQLQRIAASVADHGGRVLSPPAPNDGPDGGMACTVASPQGYILRFIHGDLLRDDASPRSDFPLRISHVNLNCADIEATRAFFQQALGFQLTDRSKMMAFLRCNQDHHAVVLADSGVNGMNHIAFMMPDWESVMRGAGRMVDHGYPIGWGIGRHGPGNNIFAYFLDPAGFVIEHTTDVLQVDDSYRVRGPAEWTWPPGRTDLWGIAPPKSEAVKQAQLAIKFARPT